MDEKKTPWASRRAWAVETWRISASLNRGQLMPLYKSNATAPALVFATAQAPESQSPLRSRLRLFRPAFGNIVTVSLRWRPSLFFRRPSDPIWSICPNWQNRSQWEFAVSCRAEWVQIPQDSLSSRQSNRRTAAAVNAAGCRSRGRLGAKHCDYSVIARFSIHRWDDIESTAIHWSARLSAIEVLSLPMTLAQRPSHSQDSGGWLRRLRGLS
jgi:hypothetical protein